MDTGCLTFDHSWSSYSSSRVPHVSTVGMMQLSWVQALQLLYVLHAGHVMLLWTWKTLVGKMKTAVMAIWKLRGKDHRDCGGWCPAHYTIVMWTEPTGSLCLSLCWRQSNLCLRHWALTVCCPSARMVEHKSQMRVSTIWSGIDAQRVCLWAEWG